MTTAHSPPAALRDQADKIAKTLKAIERGDVVPDPNKPDPKRIATVTFGVMMDDKIIKIEMAWATIREMDERFLSDFIMRQMQKKAGDP